MFLSCISSKDIKRKKRNFLQQAEIVSIRRIDLVERYDWSCEVSHRIEKKNVILSP